MGKVNNDKHLTLSPEAHKRLKLFSAKYNIPMKLVVEWFIFTLIDENGDPSLDDLKEALDIIAHDERIPDMIREYKRRWAVS